MIIKKLMKYFHKHNYVLLPENTYKRRCKCGKEQWLFSKSYPLINEYKYIWKDM